jgi:hypothetical protein
MSAPKLRHVDFGLTDGKGRKIGAQIAVWKTDAGWDARVHATRDGEVFGALRKSFSSTDWDELTKAITSRVAAMGKRYAKIAAGHRWSGRDKITGAHVTIEVAEDPEVGALQVICDKHGTLTGADNMRDAKATSTIDFCDECRDERDAKAVKS